MQFINLLLRGKISNIIYYSSTRDLTIRMKRILLLFQIQISDELQTAIGEPPKYIIYIYKQR